MAVHSDAAAVQPLDRARDALSLRLDGCDAGGARFSRGSGLRAGARPRRGRIVGDSRDLAFAPLSPLAGTVALRRCASAVQWTDGGDHPQEARRSRATR